MCRSKSDPNISQVEEDEHRFLSEITNTSVGVWTKTISADKLDVPVQFKLDTGADVSIHVALGETKKQFVGLGNIKIPVLGSFMAVLFVNNVNHSETMYVANQTKALLSRSACVKLGLITCECDVESVYNTTERYLFRSEFPKLFQFSGKLKHRITPECRPFAINTPRSVPYPLLPNDKQE